MLSTLTDPQNTYKVFLRENSIVRCQEREALRWRQSRRKKGVGARTCSSRSLTRSPTSRPSLVFLKIFDLASETWYRTKNFTGTTNLRLPEEYKGFGEVVAGLSNNISKVRRVGTVRRRRRLRI
ncbi:sacsin [Pyrus ussuriensis x Pyrus communis]|uniref:Sacsin n=1 Tax=Pyrus ussuriensis x Pyrus communis TaxID=2448454 RepID=A0A5N5H695_9ROSA|nr:sacsin [Pyrus ussuriensis x Pyrus communis]